VKPSLGELSMHAVLNDPESKRNARLNQPTPDPHRRGYWQEHSL
jgi:hypothetical protein